MYVYAIHASKVQNLRLSNGKSLCSATFVASEHVVLSICAILIPKTITTIKKINIVKLLNI